MVAEFGMEDERFSIEIGDIELSLLEEHPQYKLAQKIFGEKLSEGTVQKLEHMLKEEEYRGAIRILHEEVVQPSGDQSRYEILRAHFHELQGNPPSVDEFIRAVHGFAESPFFFAIYNQLRTIPRVHDKWGFLLRRAYELSEGENQFWGRIFQNHSVATKRALEAYGIQLLCPYYREDRFSVTRESCLIDGEPIMSCCAGAYEACRVFAEHAQKAAAGLCKLPRIERSQPRVQIPFMDNIVPVDLCDLEDWWKMEGEYE